MTMTVDELVALISTTDGEIYPFSYAANMMAAHGVNEKLVQYFHDAEARANRQAHDRTRILTGYRHGKPYEQARSESVLRLNPHLKEKDDA